MAPTQPVLAGTTLPHPKAEDGFSERVVFRGVSVEMASGAQSTDLVVSGAKRLFTLSWQAITATEKGNIITAFTAIKEGSGSFTSPDSTVYTVTRDGDAEIEFEYVLTAGGVFRYNASLRLREV
jgi:hypothetical protein